MCTVRNQRQKWGTVPHQRQAAPLYLQRWLGGVGGGWQPKGKKPEPENEGYSLLPSPS